jgi:hypothetical protein
MRSTRSRSELVKELYLLCDLIIIASGLFMAHEPQNKHVNKIILCLTMTILYFSGQIQRRQ